MKSPIVQYMSSVRNSLHNFISHQTFIISAKKMSNAVLFSSFFFVESLVRTWEPLTNQGRYYASVVYMYVSTDIMKMQPHQLSIAVQLSCIVQPYQPSGIVPPYQPTSIMRQYQPSSSAASINSVVQPSIIARPYWPSSIVRPY